MSTSQPYVLNRVQNPKAMEITYNSIRQGNTTDEELAADTGFDEDKLLDQSTSGLNLYGLIGEREYEYFTEDLAFETGDNSLDFKLTMLQNIAREADEDDWGKQSAVLLNYEYLLANNRQYFSDSDSELINEIDIWHQEVGFEPRNLRGERSKLNQVKFSNWTNQAAYLGLLHNARGSEYTVSPDPDLLVAAIREAASEVGDGTEVELVDFVSWLTANLLRLPLTSEGHFTTPVSRAFYSLAKTGRIAFVKSGDERQINLTGVPVSKADAVAKDANVIKLQE